MKKLYVFIIIFIISFIGVNQIGAVSEEKIPLPNHNDGETFIHFHNGEKVFVSKEISHEKRQFRGVYIYTKDNLNISKQDTIETYKKEYLSILNKMKEYNMNAIIFEVRPLNDAFYESELNPWSRFLTGIENNDPGWDPLKWMIEEAHKRRIDFYAGVNLFQVSGKTQMDKDEFVRSLSTKNYAYKNKDYLLSVRDENNQYEYFLNPGIPQVQQFLVDTVMELVTNYEIDAINIEGYFYPIDKLNTINDIDTYIQNGDIETMLKDWRRENITQIISQIKSKVQYYNETNNKHVQLGVTPYGVWRNYTQDRNGSYTRGITTYDFQSADVLNWVKNEYVDFIIPKINSTFEDSDMPYADVVQWWAEQVEGINVNLYIGQFMNEEWSHSTQVLNQLKFNQNYSTIKGSLLMNYNEMKQPNEVNQEVLQSLSDYWKYISFIPPAPMESQVPSAVGRLLGRYKNNQMNFSWQTVPEAKYYVVFRFKNEDSINLDDPSYIIKVLDSTNKNRLTFIDKDIETRNIYYYFIVVLDDTYKESKPVTFGIDLNPNEMFKTEVIILSITSVITISVIGFSAYKTLKKA